MQAMEVEPFLVEEGTVKMEYDDLSINKTMSSETTNESTIGGKNRHYWSAKEEEVFFEIWGRDNWRLTQHGKNMKIFNEWARELSSRLGFEIKPIEVQTKVNQYRLKYRTVLKQQNIDNLDIRWKKFQIINKILRNEYRSADAEEIPADALRKNRDIPYDEKIDPMTSKQIGNNNNVAVYLPDEFLQNIKKESPLHYDEYNNSSEQINNYDINSVTIKNEQTEFQQQNNTNDHNNIYQYQGNIQHQQQHSQPQAQPQPQSQSQSQPHQLQQIEQQHILNSNYNTPYQYQRDQQQLLQHQQQPQQAQQQPQQPQQQQQQHILPNTNYAAMSPVIQKNQHATFWNQQQQSVVQQTQKVILSRPQHMQQHQQPAQTMSQQVVVLRPSLPALTQQQQQQLGSLSTPPQQHLTQLQQNEKTKQNTHTNSININTYKAMKTLPEIPKRPSTNSTKITPNKIMKRRRSMYDRPEEIEDSLQLSAKLNLDVDDDDDEDDERLPTELLEDNIEAQYLEAVRKKNNILAEQQKISEKRMKIEERKVHLMEKFLPKCVYLQKRILSHLEKKNEKETETETEKKQELDDIKEEDEEVKKMKVKQEIE